LIATTTTKRRKTIKCVIEKRVWCVLYNSQQPDKIKWKVNIVICLVASVVSNNVCIVHSSLPLQFSITLLVKIMYWSRETLLSVDSCFSELELWKSYSACWSSTKQLWSLSNQKVTCSRHDMAENFSLGVKQQSFTRTQK